MSTVTAQPSHPLSIPAFRNYLVARLFSAVCQSAMVIIVGWQAYMIARQTMGTHAAAAQLGWIGLAQFVPLLLLTPIAGWAADRFDRRNIGAAGTTLLLMCAVILALSTYQGWVSLPLIFGIAALIGVSRCFGAAALGAIAPRIVPKEILPRTIAFSSMSWQGASILGPAAGGVLFAMVPWLPYACATVLLMLSVFFMLRLPAIPTQAANQNRHPLHLMVEGARYVRTNKLVLGTISLDLMAVLLAGATALLPVYARDILQVGSVGLGQLAAAPGLGALLTGAILTAYPIENDVGRKMLASVAVFGFATALFGATAWMPHGIAFPVALIALVVCGVMDMISVYVRQSLMQIYTPDPMRGRVAAVSGLAISASNELGDAESGFLAALIGPVAAVVGGGVGAIIVTLLWARLFPQIPAARRFDSIPRDTIPDHKLQKTE